MSRYRGPYILGFIVLITGWCVSAIGLFDHASDTPHEFINLYGDSVAIYGQGLYQNDSFFKAPIFRGTDWVMFYICCPLLALTLSRYRWLQTAKGTLFVLSLLGVFLYYAAGMAFGVQYNQLHLLYIALFSSASFGVISCLPLATSMLPQEAVAVRLPYKGIYIFLALTGIALTIAWMPDIIGALKNRRPPLLIEHYTTEVTYVLDIGIITPLCFIIIYLLKQRKAVGYVLLDMLLTLCIIIGIILPAQTVFQVKAGITIPLSMLITKAGIFILLSLFALYFKIRFLKAWDTDH